LLFEQWSDEVEDVLGDDLVAAGGGVGAVGLHHAVDAEDALEEEGEEGDAVFVGEQGVGGLELLDVVGAVVGGEGDAGEGDPGAGGFEAGEDGVEVAAGVFDAEAAEAVVAAELDDDDGGVEGEDAIDAVETVLGGVAADALIDDVVVEAEGVEVFLEEVGIAFAGVGAEAGGEGVAEADEDGAVVGGGGCGGGWDHRCVAAGRVSGGVLRWGGGVGGVL